MIAGKRSQTTLQGQSCGGEEAGGRSKGKAFTVPFQDTDRVLTVTISALDRVAAQVNFGIANIAGTMKALQ